LIADAADTGKFRDLQRLTVQYARILGLTADGEEEENDDNGGENGAAEEMEVEE
jgi:protein HIRA/HIR1